MRPGDEGRADGAANSADDDALAGLEGDGSLRAMRSVWLSMRDEEPGDGGLSALMAAAHAKAVELRPPSLWQRIAAGLRRPPALAFATVLVLAGGALVVSQQAKDEPMAVAPAARSGAAPAVAPARERADDKPAAPPPAVAEPPAVSVDTAAPADRVAPVRSNASKKPSKPAPAQVARRSANAVQDEDDNASGRREGGVVGSAPMPAPAVAAPMAPPPPPPTAPPAQSEGAAIRSSSSHDEATDEKLVALERKARTAADAGDCRTVQQLMAVVARLDAQARARLVARPEIQRCLASPATPAP